MPERLAPDARILVILVARIGDTLLITPALRALKTAVPNGRLAVLAHPARRALLEHLPFIDELGSITPRRAPLRSWLSPRRYDLAIVYGQDASLVRYAARVSRRVIAFEQSADALNKLVDIVIPAPQASTHAVLERLIPIKALGIETSDFRLAYSVTPAERETAQRWRAANLPASTHPLIGFQVASFPTKAYRDWPLESFAELGHKLLAEFPAAQFLILGGPETRDKAARLASRLPHTVVVAGLLGLRETAALLSQLDLYVGVDTGPTHLAGALGIPMVALYHCRHRGRLLAPLQHEHLCVIEHPTADDNCASSTPMSDIPANQVFSAALTLLQNR